MRYTLESDNTYCIGSFGRQWVWTKFGSLVVIMWPRKTTRTATCTFPVRHRIYRWISVKKLPQLLWAGSNVGLSTGWLDSILTSCSTINSAWEIQWGVESCWKKSLREHILRYFDVSRRLFTNLGYFGGVAQQIVPDMKWFLNRCEHGLLGETAGD